MNGCVQLTYMNASELKGGYDARFFLVYDRVCHHSPELCYCTRAAILVFSLSHVYPGILGTVQCSYLHLKKGLED